MSDSERVPQELALTEVKRAELELAVARGRMLRSASRLREDLRSLTDFRRPLRSRPWTYLGAAFALGFLLAATHRREVT